LSARQNHQLHACRSAQAADRAATSVAASRLKLFQPKPDGAVCCIVERRKHYSRMPLLILPPAVTFSIGFGTFGLKTLWSDANSWQ
jgi:hypothetical protein